MSLSSLPPGWTPERPSPLPPTPGFRRPDPPHAPATPSPLSPFSTSPPPSSAFNAPRTPISHAYSSSHYYRPPRSTLTSPNRSNYSSPSGSPTRSSRRSRIQALLSTDPLLARLTPVTIRQLSQDRGLGFTPGDREWSMRAAEGIVKVGEWLREVEGWNVGWGRGRDGEGYLPPEPGQRRKRRKTSIEDDRGMRTIQEEDELMATPEKAVRRKLFSSAETSPVKEQTSPPLGMNSPRARTSARPMSAFQLKQHRRSTSDITVENPERASPPDPALSPRRRSLSLGGNLCELSGEEDEDEEYFGCLPRSTVESYEARIEMIKAEIEELDIEGLKGKVLSYRTGIDNPLTSSSAIITATTLQLLPPLHRLTKLLSLWAVRLAVLKIVPVFLRWLENAKVALDAGVATIQHPEVVNGNQKLDEDVFSIMSETIQQKVATAGRIMDTMLDALEGREDVLPDQWIGELEDTEEGYSRWQMDAERIVLESRLRATSREEDIQAGRERAQLILENERVAEEAREDEDAVGDVLERFEDMEKGLMEAMEMHEEVQEGIDIQGEQNGFDHEHDMDYPVGLGLGLEEDLMKRFAEIEPHDLEEERGRRWSRAGSPLASPRNALLESPDLDDRQVVDEFQRVLEPIRRKISEELCLGEEGPLAILNHSVTETSQPAPRSEAAQTVIRPRALNTATAEIEVQASADEDCGSLRHIQPHTLESTSDTHLALTNGHAAAEVGPTQNVAQLAPSLDSRDSADGSEDSSTPPVSSRSSTPFDASVDKHENNEFPSGEMPVISLGAVVRDTAFVRDPSPVDNDVDQNTAASGEDETTEVHTPRVTSLGAVVNDVALFKTEIDAQTQVVDSASSEKYEQDPKAQSPVPTTEQTFFALEGLAQPSPIAVGAHSLPEMLWTQHKLLTPRPGEPEALLDTDLPELIVKEQTSSVNDPEGRSTTSEPPKSPLHVADEPSIEAASGEVEAIEWRSVAKAGGSDEVVFNNEVDEDQSVATESAFEATCEETPITPTEQKLDVKDETEAPSIADTDTLEVIRSPSPEDLAEEPGQSAAAVSDRVGLAEQRSVAKVDESDIAPSSPVDSELWAQAAASILEIPDVPEMETRMVAGQDASVSEPSKVALRSRSPELLADDFGQCATTSSDQVHTSIQRNVAKVDDSDILLPPPVDADRLVQAVASLVEETKPHVVKDTNQQDSSVSKPIDDPFSAVLAVTEDNPVEQPISSTSEESIVDEEAVAHALGTEDLVQERLEEERQLPVSEPPADIKPEIVEPSPEKVPSSESDEQPVPIADDLLSLPSNTLADEDGSYDLIEQPEINESSFVVMDSGQTPQAVVLTDAETSEESSMEPGTDIELGQRDGAAALIVEQSDAESEISNIGLLIQGQLGRQPSTTAIRAFTEEASAKLSPHQTPRSGTPSLLPSPIIRSKSPESERSEDEHTSDPAPVEYGQPRPTNPEEKCRLSTVDSGYDLDGDDGIESPESIRQQDITLPSSEAPTVCHSPTSPVVLEYESAEITPKTPAAQSSLLSSPIKMSPTGPSPRIVKEVETAPNVWTSSKASISDEEDYDDYAEGEYEEEEGNYSVQHHDDSPRKSDRDPRSPGFEEPDSLEELYNSILARSPEDDTSPQSYDDFDFDIRPLATSTPPTHSGRRRLSVSVPTELPSISELSTPRSQKSSYFGSAEKSDAFRTPASPGMGLRSSILPNDLLGSSARRYDDGNTSGFSTLVGDDHADGSVKYKAKGKATRNSVQGLFSSPALPPSEADDTFNFTPITELPTLGGNHVLTPTIDNSFWDEQAHEMMAGGDVSDNFGSSPERGRFEREETPEVETRPQQKITVPKRRAVRKPQINAVTPMKSMRRHPEAPYSGRTASLTMSDPPKPATPEPRKDFDTRVNDILMSLPRKVKLTASNLQKLNEQSGSRFIPPKQWESAIPAPRSIGSDSRSVGSAAPSYARNTSRRHLPSIQGDIKCYHLHRNDEQPPMKLYVRLVGNDRLVCRVGGGWSDLEEYLKEWAMHHGSKMRAVSESRLEIQDIPTHKGVAGQRTLRPSTSNSSLPRLRSPTPSAPYSRSRSPSMNSSRPASPNVNPAVRSVSPAFTVAAVPNRRSLSGPIPPRAVSPTNRLSECPALPQFRRSVSPSLPPLRRDATSFPIPVMHGSHNGTTSASNNKPSPTTPTSLTFPLQPQHELTPPSPHDHIDQSRPGSSSSMGLRHIPSRLSFTESAFDIAVGHIHHSSPPQPKPLPLAGPKTRAIKTMTPENQAWVEGMIGQVRKASSERRISGIFAGSDRGAGSVYAASSVGGDDAEEPVNRRVAETMGARSMTPTESRVPERMSGSRTRRVFLKKGTGGSGRGRGSSSSPGNGSIERSGGGDGGSIGRSGGGAGRGRG